MDPRRFSPQAPGQVIRVGQGELAYRAYVPDPLPPALPLEMDLVLRLSEADRALGELSGLGRALPNPHPLVGPFIRREAVLSSRIEGTQAGIADLYAYEAGQLRRSGVPEADVREVANNVRALEHGLERMETLPVSLRLLREMHAHLMEGVRGERAYPGEFRRSQNWIGRPGCTLATAEFVPPPVPQMHEALDAFEKYLHSEGDFPPLVRLAVLHYQFEAIHPFLDGNGRIGRLLLSLLTVHWDLLPLPLLCLSAYFERRREEYYLRLQGVSERGMWREWVAFFLAGVAEQAQDATDRAKRLQDLERAWRSRLMDARAPALALRLADSLLLQPVLTIPDAQRLLGVSYPAAQRHVARLTDAGVLVQQGMAHNSKAFQAPELLAIIEQEPVLQGNINDFVQNR